MSMRRYGPEHTHGARADASWTYRGVETAVIENEHLRAVVLSGKGADISSLVHKPTDTELLWRTPWGVRHPATFGAPGDPWLDHYEGGWQTVVPNGGAASTYRGAELGQHGEANLLPWDAAVTSDGPEQASVRFHVRLARTPIEVTKEISVSSGRPELVVDERVVNVGAEDLEIMYGHHIVFGPPFLDEGCLVDLPGGRVSVHDEVWPTSRLAPGATGDWPVVGDVDLSRVPGPDARSHDLAYVTGLPEGRYTVTNPGRGVTVTVRFDERLFRHLWVWQSYGGGHGYPWWGRTYNLGLEPFTSYPNRGLAEAVANGTALLVPAGGAIETRLTVEVSA
ncbi:MAG TPA: DUF4432 family protein [Actinomycetota bacterium]|nr:DUF4432 family protein [Actinomycetota bacterium]